jgi:hypothetical protein
MSPRRTVLPALAFAAGYLLVLRPRLLSWGASDDEVRRELPGDDLVEGASGRSTMAVTIDAPPDVVWPWLAQMGCQRAGWYSWDRLDNGGEPSEERIVPELQSVEAGDRLPAVPDGHIWFDVAEAEPDRSLVLRSSIDLVKMRNFDPAGSATRAFSDGTWAFVLEPLEGARTRLIVRSQGTGRPRAIARGSSLLFWEPAHWVMQTRQFHNLKRRAERAAAP